MGTCAFSSPEAQQISSDFYYGHGMYSQTLRAGITAACGDFKTLSPKCLQQLSLMNDEIGQFDIYNIYDECGRDDRRRLKSSETSLMSAFEAMSQKRVTVETADSFKVSAGYGQALNGYMCGAETAMEAWLAEPSVVAALHVKEGTSGMHYDKTATDIRPLYSQLIDQYQVRSLTDVVMCAVTG